jgi:hypothetical protein
LSEENHCWEATSAEKNYFETHIAPEIIKGVPKYFGTAHSSEDIITLSIYMIGGSTSTAAPTLLFISASSRRKKARREAQKRAKRSELLLKISGLKMADIEIDPGFQQLEQLASPTSDKHTETRPSYAAQILFDQSQSIRLRGMAIYIRHGCSVRKATANVLRIGDQFYLQSVYHVFMPKSSQDEAEGRIENQYKIDFGSAEEEDDDDSENEYEEYNKQDQGAEERTVIDDRGMEVEVLAHGTSVPDLLQNKTIPLSLTSRTHNIASPAQQRVCHAFMVCLPYATLIKRRLIGLRQSH